MNGIRQRCARPRPRIEATICLSVLAVTLAWSTTGCHDPRISVATFLDMKEALRASVVTRAEQTVIPQVEQLLPSLRIGPSDVLTVTLTGTNKTTPFEPISVRVDREGNIDLPIVGTLYVAGMELEDVERTIRKAFVPSVMRDGVVHVETVALDTADVLVAGAVPVPGLVNLRRNERNMLFAIVRAGGITQEASGRATLRRVRRPTEEIELDLTDPIDLRAALKLESLDDGDIINVHAATPNTFFVGGLVNITGPQNYPAGAEVSILQALAAAGGVRTDIHPTEATLVHKMPSGMDVHVRLDLENLNLEQSLDPNLTLAAGDILWVPHTFSTRVQDFINRNFFLRAGVSVTYTSTGVDYLNRANLQSRLLSGGTGLQGSFDPLGFLTRNQALQTLVTRP